MLSSIINEYTKKQIENTHKMTNPKVIQIIKSINQRKKNPKDSEFTVK